MKFALSLALPLVLAACAANDTDPRSQLERNLNVPVEMAGRIHPARLAYLKFVLDSDGVYTNYEQNKIRAQVLSGQKGLVLDF